MVSISQSNRLYNSIALLISGIALNVNLCKHLNFVIINEFVGSLPKFSYKFK